ncbi:hypothetical protein F7O93_36770, partial [Pseudomonas aeruginosa]
MTEALEYRLTAISHIDGMGFWARLQVDIALISPLGIKRSLIAMSKAPIGTTGRTGERCPESGVWRSQDVPSTTAPIAKGNVFPPHN